MIVRRVPLDDCPVLFGLAAYLTAVAIPAAPYSQRGSWREDIAHGPPGADRPRPLNYRRQFMPAPSPNLGLLPFVGLRIASLNYYPAGGSGLGWHTDSANPGWRAYIARPLTDLPGAFITREEIIPDDPGVAIVFKAAAGESWHAVRAEGPRLSLGLFIGSTLLARSLGVLS